jgi:MoaA/NifB/PqqE/SkfB family radical SAM enzyme
MYSPIFQYNLADRCPVHCELCGLWQKDTEEEFSKLIDIFADLEYLKRRGVKLINFTGGDPLTNPELPTIIDKTKKLGLKVAITAPANNFKTLKDKIIKQVDLFIFPVFHSEKQENDRISGHLSFYSLTKTVKMLRKRKHRVMIALPITRDMVEIIPDVYDLAVELEAILWLKPLSNAYNVKGFSEDTGLYLKHYGKKKNCWLNLAQLRSIKHPLTVTKQTGECLANCEIITGSFEKVSLNYLLNLFSLGILWWKMLWLFKK